MNQGRFAHAERNGTIADERRALMHPRKHAPWRTD
jgi:hypothetical protein